MKITKSPLFDQFRCLAGSCPDSCCKEWSVTVDDASAAYYRSLSGPLGQRLRQVLIQEDGDTIMAIEDGRCPMWQQDGLCRIQSELGHDALCKTCREFPRLTHDYGNFQEWGLELSCPEAARLILTSPPKPPIIIETSAVGEVEYDPADMEILLQTRETILSLLCDDSRCVEETLAIALLYGYHAQSLLDGADLLPFDCNSALEEARSFAKPGDRQAVLNFFKELEILTPAWKQRLDTPVDSDWGAEHLLLLRYFVERYWLQAISDLDLVGRVKLAVISCLVIKLLGGDPVQTAQLYSKEIENDPDNVEAILDGAYSHSAFTDDKLLGLLLK